MKRAADTAVVAIGIDAGEPTLVRRLIAEGALPALASLLRDGVWRRVDAPARIGSGAVWPTFFTGTDPSAHGMYSSWGWDPTAMRLTVNAPRGFVPFWQGLARNGTTVGVLDVPFAPILGLSKGFEISEWGAHDIVDGRMTVSPAAVRDIVATSGGSHPFSAGHDYVTGLDDHAELTGLSSGCVTGARLRGDLASRLLVETHPTLAIVVFSEVHRAGHHLWHTVEPEHPVYGGDVSQNASAITPNLLDIYREVDHQIGRIVETAGPDATIVVFSLHGMRPTRGPSKILQPFLLDRGLAHLETWRRRSWSERGLSTLSAIKDRVPSRLKKRYHKVVARSVRHRIAQPTRLPPYDWSRTQAFALPTDQHGWIRLNVRGREAKGIVPIERYDALCAQIEDELRALTAQDGSPLVRDVIRPAGLPGRASLHALPDLVVHWESAASDAVVRFENGSVSPPKPSPLTGQHALDGFCIVRKARHFVGAADDVGDTIAARDLHRLLVAALPASVPDVPRSSI